MCNRITDIKVRAAVAAGAKTPADVFRMLRVQRACGQCLDSLEAQIRDARAGLAHAGQPG